MANNEKYLMQWTTNIYPIFDRVEFLNLVDTLLAGEKKKQKKCEVCNVKFPKKQYTFCEDIELNLKERTILLKGYVKTCLTCFNIKNMSGVDIADAQLKQEIEKKYNELVGGENSFESILRGAQYFNHFDGNWKIKIKPHPIFEKLKEESLVHKWFFNEATTENWVWRNEVEMSDNSGKFFFSVRYEKMEKLNQVLEIVNSLEGVFLKYPSPRMAAISNWKKTTFIFYFDDYDNIEKTKRFYEQLKDKFEGIERIIWRARSNFETEWKMEMDIYDCKGGNLTINKTSYLNYQKWIGSNYKANEEDLVVYRKRNWKEVFIPKEEYIILDTETTGLGIKDRPVEVSMIRVKEGVIINRYSQLIKTNKQLGPYITYLTGINNKMLEKRGLEPLRVMKEVEEYIGSTKVIAHNASFDIKMLNNMRGDLGMDVFKKEQFIDSVAIFRNMYYGEEGYSLSRLAKRKLPFIKQKHRALEDCELLLRLLNKEDVSEYLEDEIKARKAKIAYYFGL